jgi:hypothetical protein
LKRSTVADRTSRGIDSSSSHEEKFYQRGWFDLDDNKRMTVSKVTGVGKNKGTSNGGTKVPIARVVYAGKDSQGREHAAVWVSVDQATGVTGFADAMGVYKAGLKGRRTKKSSASSVSNEDVAGSSSQPESQQTIFNALHVTAKTNATQLGKSVTTKEYNDLWEKAGIMIAQTAAPRRAR